MADSSFSLSRSPAGTPRGLSPVRLLRIGAKGFAVEEGEVLLVKERRANGSCFWTLPGGGVRPGERIRDGLQRELSEEIGCGASVGGLVTTCRYDHETRPNTTTRYLVLECTLIGEPNPRRMEGIVEAGWFDPATLPDTTLPPFDRVVSANVEEIG